MHQGLGWKFCWENFQEIVEMHWNTTCVFRVFRCQRASYLSQGTHLLRDLYFLVKFLFPLHYFTVFLLFCFSAFLLLCFFAFFLVLFCLASSFWRGFLLFCVVACLFFSCPFYFVYFWLSHFFLLFCFLPCSSAFLQVQVQLQLQQGQQEQQEQQAQRTRRTRTRRTTKATRATRVTRTTTTAKKHQNWNEVVSALLGVTQRTPPCTPAAVSMLLLCVRFFLCFFALA